MATKKLVRITHRIDSTDNWKTNNPILSKGEIGIDEDANKIKIGNGSDGWNNLEYVSGSTKDNMYYYADETNDGIIDIDSFQKPFYIISLLDNKNIELKFKPDSFNYNGSFTCVFNKDMFPCDMKCEVYVKSKINGVDDSWSNSVEIKYSNEDLKYTVIFGDVHFMDNTVTDLEIEFRYTVTYKSNNNSIYLIHYNKGYTSDHYDISPKIEVTDITTIAGQKNINYGEIFNLASKASGEASHAEGYDTTASGDYSHAEGQGTIASGNSSHSEAVYTVASGYGSHAEGQGTIASGPYSHAEGVYASSTGLVSHTEGEHTIASGDYSHAEGYYTKASSENQHVQGKCNIEDTKDEYAHIVGNGKNSSNRSNAHTLDWSGNAWYAGNIKIGGSSYDDTNAKEIATKEYVDTLINELKAKINS